LRDRVVDFLKHYHQLTGIALVRMLCWLGLSPRKFHRWKDRYGKANEHNAMIPRDHWIEPEERVAIIQFARQYPLEGYRRLTFMMLDADIVAVSPWIFPTLIWAGPFTIFVQCSMALRAPS
jgi:hypothetical protein